MYPGQSYPFPLQSKLGLAFLSLDLVEILSDQSFSLEWDIDLMALRGRLLELREAAVNLNTHLQSR